MESHITHIRVSESFPTSTERITEVKLSDGTIETVAQVIRYLEIPCDYFYTTSGGSKAYVEAVHPVNRNSYIRTKGDSTTSDNLLSLPRF